MPESKNLNIEEHHHPEEVIKLIFKGVIPIVLLLAGIALLALRLPGWSIIFGLPLVVFGVVFLIYTYDEILSKNFETFPKKLVKCKVCGKPTPYLSGTDPENAVCFSCQEEGR